MKHYRLFYNFGLCWLPVLLLGLLVASPAAAGVDPEEQFQRLHGYYQRLMNTEAGDARENWQRAAAALQQLHRQQARQAVGPKSLYLLGNLYHQMYRRSGIPLDLAEAVTSLQDVQGLYPDHPLADDALFYVAHIFFYERQDRQRAEQILGRLLKLYPTGDMAAGARAMLASIRPDADRAKVDSGGKPVIRADGKYKQAVASRGKIEQARRTVDRAPNGEERIAVMPVRYWSSDSYTRVVVETESPLNFRSHLRENGDSAQRLYLDLDGARLSPRIGSPIKQVADGLLKQIQHTETAAGGVRLILDTQTRLDDYKVFSLDNPHRVVIDLIGQPVPTLPPLPDPPPVMARPATGDSLSLAQQLGMGVRRIVIDPGHGGRDPGAISPSGIKEKDVNLRISRLLATELRRLGHEVILTRDRDIFLPLEERTAIANSHGADLFISVHVNAAANRQARGVETYILDVVASDDHAMRVAARENASSARSFGELQGIVQELLNHAKLQESQQLAEFVHQTTMNTMRGAYGEKIEDRGVRRAPFVVLIGARMPALLLEVGFLSNPEEERLLSDERYLARLVQGIAGGVKQYATNLSLAGR
ncbi:N-acetylmuramoyl-L-alanine amidase [Desulfurivibrio dismutans]|uniref:N-acetylmuramoyl-L-alanine amidase n=1 Tax=Desulfurivibrio dismutans TaxID=1398908 RepID=UPI0023D9E04A|nr:N-acetylmuramoyl-L-alanine amidase [Desulfurivibrio alkaliphilus]MDF1615626.1 N-acetylmuramoyl-L-alanine amidase [Desulfurivibrio alkaliphilus]